jgi:hypothetical protein
LVRNTIFKLDKEAKILTRDPDRGAEPFGEGKNTYNVEVRQVDAISVAYPITLEDLKKDVIIILTRDSVGRWFKDVYES